LKQASSHNLELLIYDEVDSTNDALRRMLAHEASGASATKAVMALAQTQGRGRLGRSWVSPPGGLYVSLALELPDTLQRTAALSLIVSLALQSELTELARANASKDYQAIQIKWPNDLVCEQGKLAGILIELVSLPSGEKTAIVGVGVNIKYPGNGTECAPGAAYLSDFCQQTPDLQQAARQMITAIQDQYTAWKEADYDFAPFKEDYLANLSLIGQCVTVSNHRGEAIAEGTVKGIDNQGLLLLQGNDQLISKVATGEVTLS
jgi:BirA family biotin operon repressor/biotin-[acetyl-CoA-carboxylase] ligase